MAALAGRDAARFSRRPGGEGTVTGRRIAIVIGFTWTGFYFGANVGGSLGSKDADLHRRPAYVFRTAGRTRFDSGPIGAGLTTRRCRAAGSAAASSAPISSRLLGARCRGRTFKLGGPHRQHRVHHRHRRGRSELPRRGVERVRHVRRPARLRARPCAALWQGGRWPSPTDQITSSTSDPRSRPYQSQRDPLRVGCSAAA